MDRCRAAYMLINAYTYIYIYAYVCMCIHMGMGGVLCRGPIECSVCVDE